MSSLNEYGLPGGSPEQKINRWKRIYDEVTAASNDKKSQEQSLAYQLFGNHGAVEVQVRESTTAK